MLSESSTNAVLGSFLYRKDNEFDILVSKDPGRLLTLECDAAFTNAVVAAFTKS